MAINYKGSRRSRFGRTNVNLTKKVVAGLTAGALVGTGAAIVTDIVKDYRLESKVDKLGEENLVLDIENKYLSGETKGNELLNIYYLQACTPAIQDEKLLIKVEDLQRDLVADYISGLYGKIYSNDYVKENIHTQGGFSSEQEVTYEKVATGEEITIARIDENVSDVMITSADGKGNLTTKEYDSDGNVETIKTEYSSREEIVTACRKNTREMLEKYEIGMAAKDKKFRLKRVDINETGEEIIYTHDYSVGKNGELQIESYVNGELVETSILGSTDKASFDKAMSRGKELAKGLVKQGIRN